MLDYVLKYCFSALPIAIFLIYDWNRTHSIKKYIGILNFVSYCEFQDSGFQYYAI
jgi:hypothetical protein